MKTNHPTKGSSIKVEPIRRLEDIKAIKKLLKDSPRDLLLFTMGINNGLRIGDLLRLKVEDVQHLRPNEYLRIKEHAYSTGKRTAFHSKVDSVPWEMKKSLCYPFFQQLNHQP
ncbi:hypothetical protein [Desulfonatronospira thiodismutans]|uniref:hypothetical protein n=1 Tax=Desulfonatronospira thiodismutans TaxID=488939 RepID=UPI000197596A